MLARSWSAAIHGVDIKTVEVEVNVTGAGQDTTIQMVGLPDAVVRESRERVWSALYESGFRPPPGRTTINLAPAELRKTGSAFDLAIALGILAGQGIFHAERLSETMVIGELGFDGTIRPTQGALPVAVHAREQAMRSVLVPQANANEAAAGEIPVFGMKPQRSSALFYSAGRFSSQSRSTCRSYTATSMKASPTMLMSRRKR